MEDEIKRADEQIPDLKPDEGQTEVLIPANVFRPEESSSHCGTRAVRGGKLHTYDWLDDLPTPPNASDLVEVQFKNTRKGYYRNSTGIALKNGDIVAVESSPGHDIGEVTLQGRLVYLQMHKNHINPATYEYKRIYRIARQTDLDKWEEAKGLEQETMLEARRIAQDLRLNMKIGDVEYQGDRTKAIFYYIADERVDFRELIKVLAERFRVRIEMRQIGARQEAGRIGGIGPCGREMCCASWMTSFVSVSTHSARIQDLSLNPVKLAGQCGKLKCCLNFELAAYLDAIRSFPPTDKPLETSEGTYYFFKYDIFKHLMWYSPQKDSPTNIVAVEAAHVVEIQKMNQDGKKPDTIGGMQQSVATEDDGYSNVVELDDDLTRFDNKNNKRSNNQGRQQNGRGNNRQQNGRGGRQQNNQNGEQGMHNRQTRAQGGQNRQQGQNVNTPEAMGDRTQNGESNLSNRQNRPQGGQNRPNRQGQNNRGERQQGQNNRGDRQGQPQQNRPNRPLSQQNRQNRQQGQNRQNRQGNPQSQQNPQGQSDQGQQTQQQQQQQQRNDNGENQ